MKYKTDLVASIKKHRVIKESNSRIEYDRDALDETSYKDGISQLITRTENKLSMYHSWHDTFEDAQEHLILHNKKKIESLLRQIRYLESNIEKVKNIKKF